MNDCTSCFHGFDHQTTVHCYSERLLYPMIKLRIYKGSPDCSADRISATSHQPARQAWRPSLVRRFMFEQVRGVHGVAHRTPAAITRPPISQIRRIHQTRGRDLEYDRREPTHYGFKKREHMLLRDNKLRREIDVE